jgi:hypothetical protein
MEAKRSTALTATPKTMEERRASIMALIERTEDPKLKESMRLILKEMEKRPELSPKARAWFEANKARLEETGKRTLERAGQGLETAPQGRPRRMPELPPRGVIREHEFEDQLARLILAFDQADEYIAGAQEMLAKNPEDGMLCDAGSSLWSIPMPPVLRDQLGAGGIILDDQGSQRSPHFNSDAQAAR